jgi:hypothetical protein
MENRTMTLATFNRFVDRATAESKTEQSSGRLGARHAGARESMFISLMQKSKRGKYAKVAGRHARPARAFF